jgi:hypothetical protein
MDEFALKIMIAEFVSRARQLSKEADDLSSQLSDMASKLDDKYRHVRERDTVLSNPDKEQR